MTAAPPEQPELLPGDWEAAAAMAITAEQLRAARTAFQAIHEKKG